MTRSERPHAPGTDDDVGQLLARAGRRPAPPAALEAAVREAVHAEWQAGVRNRQRSRRLAWRAAAAIGALVIGASWLVGSRLVNAPPALVATFVGARGGVTVTPTTAGMLLASGTPLAAGTVIDTGPSGGALLSAGGNALRAGSGTRLALEAPGRVRLLRGRLYVDSGPPGHRADDLTVVTPLGDVAHLGTQFQVELDHDSSLAVFVREGRVRVSRASIDETIGRGQGLRIGASGGVARIRVDADDPVWTWVSDFVPPFAIEGRSLSAFLDWVCRETGRELVFVVPATRADADRTTLNGSISGLTPLQALDAVIATTRFRYDVTAPGQLRIAPQAAGDDRIGMAPTPRGRDSTPR